MNDSANTKNLEKITLLSMSDGEASVVPRVGDIVRLLPHFFTMQLKDNGISGRYFIKFQKNTNALIVFEGYKFTLSERSGYFTPEQIEFDQRSFECIKRRNRRRDPDRLINTIKHIFWSGVRDGYRPGCHLFQLLDPITMGHYWSIVIPGEEEEVFEL